MIVQERRYYAVECKCGHTGSRRTYIPIRFAVVARSKKEAAAIGREIPRCKHHHKDCILNVTELSYEEFIELRKENDNDPFLRCHSIQEQCLYDLSDRFVADPHYSEINKEKRVREEQIHQTFQGKKKIRNPKRFIRFNQLQEAYCY